MKRNKARHRDWSNAVQIEIRWPGKKANVHTCYCCCLVTQYCLTLCDPMDRGAWWAESTPGGLTTCSRAQRESATVTSHSDCAARVYVPSRHASTAPWLPAGDWAETSNKQGSEPHDHLNTDDAGGNSKYESPDYGDAWHVQETAKSQEGNREEWCQIIKTLWSAGRRMDSRGLSIESERSVRKIIQVTGKSHLD